MRERKRDRDRDKKKIELYYDHKNFAIADGSFSSTIDDWIVFKIRWHKQKTPAV